MAHHIEFVYGPLGEETRLACACPRDGSHLRPNSESRVADEFDEARLAAALPARRAERMRPGRRAQPRTRFTFVPSTGVHARRAA
ncbi:hypothetical protein [Agromyces lapidis]|uniref:Uncharacterized protein n=1 Tax=Agromyces lapidis TaxID=279574 RepID=A0ABV5SNS6_9MICO|nr:hypothetical protein [Agromyces lapidis]